VSFSEHKLPKQDRGLGDDKERRDKDHKHQNRDMSTTTTLPQRKLKVDEYVNEKRLTLSFGKHRGKHITKVPKKYLAWMIKTLELPVKIKEAISFELVYRKLKLK
jgi:uncharacterized protein (DUF3820 family)